MKKKEIIEQLSFKGVKSEEIQGMGLKELRGMLDNLDGGNIATIEKPETVQNLCHERNECCKPIPDAVMDLMIKKSTPSIEKPSINDKGWTQYVMSLFDDDELEGDSPRLEGLRRVAGLLMGTIREEGCNLITAPNQDNGFRACAKAWLVIFNGNEELRFEALADACSENCTGEFVIYPTAIADTRAKARCYRNALRLKRVLAAEEKCGDVSISTTNPENIAVGQITAIKMLSSRLNVDPVKLSNELFEGKDFKSLQVLSYNQAQELVKKLNELRANKQ
jgi:hypothetical protein